MPAETPAANPRAALIAAALACAAGGAAAQSQRTLTIQPSVSTTLTATDNRNLASTGRESDVVMQVSPSLRVISTSGPLQGSVGYQLSGVVNARSSERNEVRHALDSALTWRPLDDRFSIVGRASYQRQTISAFGVQSADPAIQNDNSTDVARIGIAPTLRGRLGGAVDYEFRAARDTTRAKDTTAGDGDTTSASAHLGGMFGLFGWAIDGSRMQVQQGLDPRTTDDRAFASVIFQPDVELRLALRGGNDWSDALGNGRERKETWGASATWTPTDRTLLHLDFDRRYFGNAHTLTFQHRMRRSSWRYSDVRSADAQTGSLRPTAYELLNLLYLPFEPDPIKRDALVQRDLAAAGIDPNFRPATGFLSSRRSLSRRQELSFVVNGLRDSITFSAFHTELRSLFDSQLTGSIVDAPVRQAGLAATLTHRLSPSDWASVMFNQAKTFDAGSQPGNEQRMINLTWSTKPGPRSALSIGGRYVEFDGPRPYTETGLNASLSVQF